MAGATSDGMVSSNNLALRLHPSGIFWPTRLVAKVREHARNCNLLTSLPLFSTPPPPTPLPLFPLPPLPLFLPPPPCVSPPPVRLGGGGFVLKHLKNNRREHGACPLNNSPFMRGGKVPQRMFRLNLWLMAPDVVFNEVARQVN